MKRVLTVAVILLLCMSIALPLGVSADIIKSPTADPLMVVESSLGDIDESVNTCIIVTTVEDAKKNDPDITEEEAATLVAAYEALIDGSAKLPIEGEHAIREVVDISFRYEGCRLIPEHGRKDEALKAEGVVLTLKLNLGVEAGANIAAFTFIDGEWAPIVETVNNGDGTVTCVFEDLCPVAFAVLG